MRKTKPGSLEAIAPLEHNGGRRFDSSPGYQKRNRFRVILGENLGNPECPFMRRWVIETPIGSLRLHHWMASDDDRHFHDHPWWFLTVVLLGSYTDCSPEGRDRLKLGSVRFRRAHHQHTVEVPKGGCWTAMVTGPHTRFWGFWVGGKFRKSNRYFLEWGNHPCQ